jgi:DNA-binding NarL/FixJ family response regulator
VQQHKLNSNGSKHPNQFYLTEREILFLKYITTDLTYRTIGTEMGISERLAEHTRNSLFEKFGVHSRAELAIIAQNSGLMVTQTYFELKAAS